MSQQQRLERVFDLLLNEDQDKAAELLHQIIVEKARTIYESIVVDEEFAETDVVGGDPEEDFTAEISADEDEIDADQEAGGEPEADDDLDSEGDEADDATDQAVEDRVEDLESQLAELRAEFDALMGEELQEPNHADLAADIDAASEDEMDNFSFDDEDATEVYETADEEKLEKAPEAKDKKKDKKVDEETKFLSAVSDTGQRGTAKLVGTGKNSKQGAENNASPYTHAPSKADFGGKPVKIGSGKGGEYGKYNGETAKNDTPTDNVDVKPKSSSIKADTTPKYTGGKSAGEGFAKSPLTKKPA